MSKNLFLSLALIIGITTLAQQNISDKNFPQIPKKILRVEPAPEQLEAWQRIKNSNPLWEVMWNEYTGASSSITGPPLNFGTGDYAERAAQFLRQNHRLFKMGSDLYDLKIIDVQNRNNIHVIFQQFVEGVPVENSIFAVHLNKQSQIYYAAGSYFDDIRIASVTPSIKEELAEKIVLEDLENSFKGCEVKRYDSKLVIISYGDIYKLCWCVKASIENPDNYLAYYIDAQNGNVLGGGVLMNYYTTGNGNVYLSHPEAGSSVNVTLTNLVDPGYSLSGKHTWVINDDATAAYEPDKSFVFDPTNTHFDEVNVYYHTNIFFDNFLNNLGYPYLNYPNTLQRILLEVHAGTNANYAGSQYYTNHIKFGDGDGISYNDFAKENTVIYHEVTHLVIEDITASGLHDLTGVYEIAAMGEAFCDYLAGSFAGTSLMGVYVSIPGPDRNLDNNYTMNDWSSLLDYWHRSQIFSGALWDLRTALGTTIADNIIFEGLDNLDQYIPTFADGRAAIIAADNTLYGGIHKTTIEIIFANRLIGSYPTTWSNEVILLDNYTIASGSTVTCSSGTVVKSYPGIKISVNGTLNAVGTSTSKVTFDRVGTSGQWGGIQFNAGSNGNIQYANISNCSPGISLYSSNYIKIENCTFTDCFNSIFAMGGRTYFYKNTITGSYYSGIKALSSSSITLAKQTLGQGSNQIKDGRTGSYAGPAIYADGNSYVLAGDEIFGDGGYNSITNYPSFVTSDNAWVDACYNWWGSYPPSSSGFLTYNGGTINYDPALSSAPSLSKLSAQTESSTNEKLSKALVLKSKGDFNTAQLLLEQLLEENKDNNLTRFIIVQLGDCINNLKGDLTTYAKNKKIDSKYDALINELKADKKANDGEIETAIKMYEKIISAKPETEVEKSILFKTAVLYESFKNDKQTAEKYYDELIKKYPEDELAKIIYLQRGQMYDAKNNYVINNESAQEESFGLEQNNPNPFNPTTKITFTLPTRDVVKLKVYDILGREIAVLAEGVFEVGRHEIEFNASRLPSGVYFYNLTTSTSSVTKKMLFLK